MKCRFVVVMVMFTLLLSGCGNLIGNDELRLKIYTGNLQSGNYDFWIIDVTENLEMSLVSVQVRYNQFYPYQEPLWLSDKHSITIYNKDANYNGYEYKISITH